MWLACVRSHELVPEVVDPAAIGRDCGTDTRVELVAVDLVAVVHTAGTDLVLGRRSGGRGGYREQRCGCQRDGCQ